MRTLAESDLAPGTDASGLDLRGMFDNLTGLMAQLSLSIGGVSERMDKESRERYQLTQNIYPVSIPAQSVQVPASGILTISSAELLSPRTSNVWDVRRISIFGLASTSESVDVYKAPLAGA